MGSLTVVPMLSKLFPTHPASGCSIIGRHIREPQKEDLSRLNRRGRESEFGLLTERWRTCWLCLLGHILAVALHCPQCGISSGHSRSPRTNGPSVLYLLTFNLQHAVRIAWSDSPSPSELLLSTRHEVLLVTRQTSKSAILTSHITNHPLEYQTFFSTSLQYLLPSSSGHRNQQ